MTVRVIEISDADAHTAIDLYERAANAGVGGNTFGENDAVDAIAKALATARAEGAEEMRARAVALCDERDDMCLDCGCASILSNRIEELPSLPSEPASERKA